MYGFYERTLDGPERGNPYSIQVGYIKGSGPSFTATIQELPGGTASNDCNSSVCCVCIYMQRFILSQQFKHYFIVGGQKDDVIISIDPSQGTCG